METFLVLAALALSLTIVLQIVDEVLPLKAPAVVHRILAVAVAAGVAWLLGYSVFAAFGQELRAEWMHPVFTGFALVAVGDFLRATVNAIGRGRSAVETVDGAEARAA
jgi:hypothetical protein